MHYDYDHHEKTMKSVDAEKKKSFLEEMKKKLRETQQAPKINRNESDQMKELEK